MKVVVLFLALAALAAASQGNGREQLQEDFGYVEVRPGAHMFWVMYHVDQPGDATDYPLIMWLQGGPGASGVGYGNFEELGPYDINGNKREHAWTKKANVMFVDNPVGTGYSYVEDYSQLATDNTMIALDLVEVIKSAFKDHPHMQVMPFYVFAESYGGKMTVDFALEFEKAIKNGDVVSDFRGVALGDSWISPMDSVNTWGTFLYQMGIVNRNGLQAIDESAASTQAAVDAGSWSEATNRWSETEVVVMIYGNNVNFYNVLAKDDIYKFKMGTNKTDLSFMSPSVLRLYENHVRWQTRDLLDDFMNGEQATHWNIPAGVIWDSQGGMVFNRLAGDFMKPVIDSVVKLLTETTLEVVVFTGNLDLICDTPGTYRWIENMDWPGKPEFMAAKNKPLYITDYSSNAATLQSAGQFSVYTIMRSGHMVPIDAPVMSLKMLDMIFASSKEQKKTPTLKNIKEEALKEEAKKEEKAAKETKQEESQEETKQEEQKPAKEEKAPKEKQSKKVNKQEKAPKQEKQKQEKADKQEKIKQKENKQEKAPKQQKYKEKVAKQEKVGKQERNKQKENKQERAPKQERKPKQESRKQEGKKDVNRAKAKVIASRQHQQQQQRGRQNSHPGPLPDARPRR